MSSEINANQLRQFCALGVDNPISFLIYLRITNNEKLAEPIEVDIDLNSLDDKDDGGLVSQEERVKALEELEKAGFVEILQSTSWQHRKLLVYPMKKVIDERKKAKKERQKARKGRNKNAT